MSSLPPWGTRAALAMGIAHPDWPLHTPETRAKYEWPTGRWWLAHASRGSSADVDAKVAARGSVRRAHGAAPSAGADGPVTDDTHRVNREQRVGLTETDGHDAGGVEHA